LTHQTSRRCIDGVSHNGFSPFQGLNLPVFILRHAFLSGFQVMIPDIRPDHVLDKLAEVTTTSHPIEAVIKL
jgi:hypothetical protein